MSADGQPNPFVARLVRDLGAFSPELIDAGANPAAAAAPNDPPDALHGVFRQARQLAALVTVVLREAESDPRDGHWEESRTRVPLRASPSRSPGDWRKENERIVPFYWRRVEVLLGPSQASLRWVLSLLERADARLEAAQQHCEKRKGDLRDELPVLRSHEPLMRDILGRRGERLRTARGDLASAREEIFRAFGAALFPSPRVPVPFPSSPAWRALMLLAQELSDPLAALQSGIKAMLANRGGIADVPWLYQRWCGLQLLTSFARSGASVQGDAVSALYAGGAVELVLEDARIALYIEPRVTRDGAHPSGYYACRGSEASPDFLIVTPGPEGTDAFCLDATLSSSDEILRSKFRYLDLLASQRTVKVAGTPTHKPPLWAWAMAPLVRDQCELRDPDGSRGLIPMNPLRWSPAPLDAWVADVVRHARVWTRGHAARGAPAARPLAGN